uniref:C2H2-type domain-containing protein n=1 Tax=viral metagenome TaxID=1070528 RepID=A0A6C0JHG2_9ZZZZ
MKQNETNLVPKSSDKYTCTVCDYNTCRQSQFNRHITTVKHKIRINETNETILGTKSTKCFQCTCGIDFNSRTTLWRHKQICSKENKNSGESLIQYLISENKELKNMIMNVCKQVQPSSNNNINNNNNNIINSNNKTFNLQVFLNETCKDAMNISDFIESVKLQVSDLENVGKVGYIEGISNIIIKNLQALEVEKRPVHCTDQKREVMYVKEDNVWEKEDEANKKLRNAIRKIAHKNICMFKAFREKYPDCEEYDSKKNSQYNTIVYESMGGKGDNDYEKDTKIIKKIAKVVGIEK